MILAGLQRGMILWGEVREKESRGSEQFHSDGDPCPWVVVSANRVHQKLPIATVAPLSSKLDKHEFFRNARVRVPKQLMNRYRLRHGAKALGDHDSLVLTEQVRVFAHERFVGDGPVAWLDGNMLAAIENGLKHVLDFR